jgi:hypothetical protein
MVFRRVVPWTLLLGLAAAPAAAQDQGLDPLLFARPLDSGDAADVRARGVQLFRLPLSVRMPGLDGHRWRLRVRFPVSLTSLRVEGASDVGAFVKKLGIAAIVPGLELELPVGARGLMRPFVEAGVGKGTEGGSVEVLYGVGLRARMMQPVKRLNLMIGGAASHRKRQADVRDYDQHSTFEAGVDGEVPLGFSIGQKAARGGLFTIARGFSGLELRREGLDPIVLHRQFEAGVSFSTAPVLRIWKVRIPWIAAGYQFGHTISGVRIYAAFPL